MLRYMSTQRNRPPYKRRTTPLERERAWLSSTEDLFRRMGDPKERLRWLVEDFARRGNFLDPDRAPDVVVSEVTLFVLYQNGPGTMYLGKKPQMRARDLTALSLEIDEGVRRFLNGEDWTIPIDASASRLRLSRTLRRQTFVLGPNRGKNYALASWRSQHSARTLTSLIFRLAAQELVGSQQDWLAKCRGCGMIFVSADLRQSYCTPRCSAASRMRKLRAPKQKPKRPTTVERRASLQPIPTRL